MPQQFVTVSEAQKLTGKSERTIRRFLKAHVDKYPEHFEMETQSGREIWLIESEFLSRHYPLEGMGEVDTVTSRDSAGQNIHGSKTLQKEWQKSKQEKHDKSEQSSNESTGKVADEGDNDRDKVVTGVTHSELWELVKELHEQLKEKDKQLDKYFTRQHEMMEKMGTLMEQGNFLLAQSQGAKIENKDEVKPEPTTSNVVDVDVDENAQDEVVGTTNNAKTKKGSQSTKKTKATKKSDPKKKSWWSVFGNAG